MPHSLRTTCLSFRAIKFLACGSCLAIQAFGEEQSVSEPLDEPIVIHERLVSNESEEVPPEPVPPPAAYQSFDVLTPAMVAEQILRLRDSLGEQPLSGRPGFQPLSLMNESQINDTLDSDAPSHSELSFDVEERADSEHAASAPWERDEDRRMLAERLRSMANRPMEERPRFVPHAPLIVENPYQTTATPLNIPAPPDAPEAQQVFNFNSIGIDGRCHATHSSSPASPPAFSAPCYDPANPPSFGSYGFCAAARDAQTSVPGDRYSSGTPRDYCPAPARDTLTVYPGTGYSPVSHLNTPMLTPNDSPADPQINVLRQSARQLEESAHTLECLDQFERADQIRELAQQLRQDARRLRLQPSEASFRHVRSVFGTEESQSYGNCPGAPETYRNARIPRY